MSSFSASLRSRNNAFASRSTKLSMPARGFERGFLVGAAVVAGAVAVGVRLDMMVSDEKGP
jgi:hypothetical protein